jgi:hypothetical protein
MAVPAAVVGPVDAVVVVPGGAPGPLSAEDKPPEHPPKVTATVAARAAYMHSLAIPLRLIILTPFSV